MNMEQDRRRQRRKRKMSFTEALKQKYCVDQNSENMSMSGFTIEIAFHGKPKTNGSDAELAYLRNVILNDTGMCKAGLPHDGLRSLCPNVVDLDISDNYLSNWSEVLNILSQLPCLKYVNVARNPLESKSSVLEKWDTSLPGIENLVLNGTKVPWSDILKLSKHIPSLKELHLCENDYDKVTCNNTDITQHLPNLNCLRLNSNKIQSLPNINILNGSEVTCTERDKAERHYLRFFMDKEHKPDQYYRLEKTHGKPKPLIEINIGRPRGFQEWINLTLVYKDQSVTSRVRVVEPVGKLRHFAARKFCLYASLRNFKMYHLACGPCHKVEDKVFEELRGETLPMSRFDIMEGDQVHIDLDEEDCYAKPKGFLHYITIGSYMDSYQSVTPVQNTPPKNIAFVVK